MNFFWGGGGEEGYKSAHNSQKKIQEACELVCPEEWLCRGAVGTWYISTRAAWAGLEM